MMNDKISMNEVIGFIEKSIEKSADFKFSSFNDEISLSVYLNDELSVIFEAFFKSNRFRIFINPGKLQLDVLDMDLARFRVEALKAKKYSEYKVEEKFRNIFNDLCN